jgi:hypothetical protein
MGQNGMRNSINRMTLVFKMPLITAHEWQMGINDTVPNDHYQYLLFIISHYHSCFKN